MQDGLILIYWTPSHRVNKPVHLVSGPHSATLEIQSILDSYTGPPAFFFPFHGSQQMSKIKFHDYHDNINQIFENMIFCDKKILRLSIK